MSWVDWAILIFVLFFARRGFKNGLVIQVFDLAGSVFALYLSFRYFGTAGKFLQNWLKVSSSLTNLMGFLLICLGVSGSISLFARSWHKKEKSILVTAIDSWGGALFSALKALIITAVILLLVSALPPGQWQKQVQESGFAQDILRLTPFFYAQFEKTLPANMPRLVLTPEGVNLSRLDLERIAHGRCLICGAHVRLMKYERRGLSFLPCFQCSGCGAFSDGCLTYEGYHLFYRECPSKAQARGKEIMCRFWPEQGAVEVKSPCPVCGEDET
ncbi:MAG: CvpA family protein [Bacillota bacterium]